MRYDKSKAVQRAQQHVAKGKPRRALAQYREVIDHDRSDPHVWLKIAELHKRLDELTESADAFREAGRNFHERGFCARALASFQQAARIDALDGELQMQLARLCFELRRDADAVRYLARAVDLFVDQSRPQRAIEAMCKLVELSPGDLHRRYRLATMYQAERMPTEAAQHYVGLASVLMSRGDARRALQVLKPAYQAQPDNTAVLEAMARAFSALGLCDREAAVLRERERIMSLAREVAGAEPRLARGTSRRPPTDPPDVQLHELFNEAVVYMRYGLPDRAIPLLRSILDADPEHDRARRALARLLNAG